MADDPSMALMKALDAVYCSGAVGSVEDAQIATEAVLFSLKQSGYVLAPRDGGDLCRKAAIGPLA